ncbi:MAG: hypothetical protein RJB56_1152 [Actinomycetota bacterium]|jgi:MFS family permease
MSETKSVLRDRNFQFLWAGQTISSIGNQISGLALPVLAVTMLHATEWQVGLMNAAGLSMFLLIGLPAGAWVDRWRKRRVMILAMFFSGVAGFGFLIAALIGDASALPIIIASEALIAFCGLVYNITQVSARQALCPEHLLGRMNASIRCFVWGVMPISAISAGAFATWFVLASPLRGMKNIVAEAEQN